MKKIILMISAFVCAALFSFSTGHAALVANGGFDYPDPGLNNGQWKVYYRDQIPGWTTGSYGMEIQKNTVVRADSGNYYVELDTHDYSQNGVDTNSSIFQMVDLDVGTYELSFMYHARLDIAGANDVRVSIGDLDHTVSMKKSDMTSDWEEISLDFYVSQADEYELMFEALGTQFTRGGFIDTVSIDALHTPVPASFWLFGTGLLGIAHTGRRKRMR